MEKRRYLDRQFSAFVAAVDAAANEGTMVFNGNTIEFAAVRDKDNKLIAIQVGRELYNLSDNRANRAAVAAAGLLGSNLIDKGQRALATVRLMKRQDAAKKAHADIRNLWGVNYAERVWELHMPEARRPVVADAALQILRILTADPHKVEPRSIREARALCAGLPRLNEFDFKDAMKMVSLLRK